MSILEKLRYFAFLFKHDNEAERPDAIGAYQNPIQVAAVFLNGSGDICDRAAHQYCMLVGIDEQLSLFERIKSEHLHRKRHMDRKDALFNAMGESADLTHLKPLLEDISVTGLGRLIEYGRRKELVELAKDHLKTRDPAWYQMVIERVEKRKPNRNPGGKGQRAKRDSKPKPPEYYISKLSSIDHEEVVHAKYQLLRTKSDVIPALIAYLKDVKGRYSLPHRSAVAELLAEMNDERVLKVLRVLYVENVERLIDEMRPEKMRQAGVLESAISDIDRISGPSGRAYVSPIRQHAQFGADLQASIRRLTPATTDVELRFKVDHSVHQYIWLFSARSKVIGIWINDGICDPGDPQLFIQLALNEHKTLVEAEGTTLAECGFDHTVIEDFAHANWTIHPTNGAVLDESAIQGGVYVMLRDALIPLDADRHELRVAPESMGLHPVG